MHSGFSRQWRLAGLRIRSRSCNDAVERARDVVIRRMTSHKQTFCAKRPIGTTLLSCRGACFDQLPSSSSHKVEVIRLPKYYLCPVFRANLKTLRGRHRLGEVHRWGRAIEFWGGVAQVPSRFRQQAYSKKSKIDFERFVFLRQSGSNRVFGKVVILSDGDRNKIFPEQGWLFFRCGLAGLLW